MDDQVSVIFEQLNQICEQYKKEVPGRRHAWPKSIKDRILALQRAGVSGPQIAKRVPIPYATIMSWSNGEKKGFLPVKVVRAKRSPTVTVRGGRALDKASDTKAESLTVTVVTPEGFRIEGLPVTEAMSWLRGSHGA